MGKTLVASAVWLALACVLAGCAGNASHGSGTARSLAGGSLTGPTKQGSLTGPKP